MMPETLASRSLAPGLKRGSVEVKKNVRHVHDQTTGAVTRLQDLVQLR